MAKANEGAARRARRLRLKIERLGVDQAARGPRRPARRDDESPLAFVERRMREIRAGERAGSQPKRVRAKKRRTAAKPKRRK